MDSVKIIVRYRADLKAVDKRGDSAFMKAFNSEMEEVVQTLIQGGAKINKQNKKVKVFCTSQHRVDHMILL